MLTLSIAAPFAACRTFTAGWYRPTATFLTPSAAYGLLLNLAGIESRLCESDAGHPGTVPSSLTRPGLPAVRLALGAPSTRGDGVKLADDPDAFPGVQSLYQQLHNYPVGSSGSERAKTTFGNKYNVTPVRREVLVNLRVIAVLEAAADLEAAVRDALAGRAAGRYGLPFIGDNSFLPDSIAPLDVSPPTFWYQALAAGEEGLRPRTTRLTTWIDRADLSRTRSGLYAPTPLATAQIPETAWTTISPP